MSAIKYVIDEDVAKYLGIAINRVDANIEVRRVVKIDELGTETKDPTLLLWAEANGFSVVTNDKSTMPAHARDHLAAGRHTWGVFIIRKGFTAREIIDWLILIHEASQSEEWQDQVRFIPFT